MRFTNPTILTILAASANAYSAKSRTFAVNHFYGKGPLVEGRVDPIVNPGTASGHTHTIQGGNAFGMTMTDRQALDKSTCTSSLVKNDKSNYWTPKLFFKADDGTLHDVELFYMNVYYFFEATTDKIQAFPPGLRILVGDSTLRTPPATGGKSILDLADGTPQPVQWTCPRSNANSPLYPTDSDGRHGVGIQDPGNKGSGVGFPDKNCDGYASPLRADIHFPSCYDPSQGLTAYKTNMQFPTNGNCPKGWIHTPHMFYEVYWNTPKFASQWTPGQGKQPFVLSNGDPTGYSLHADFISGWDVATLQQIIDNCDAGDAGMDRCPGLIGGLNDPGDSCNIQSPIQENIFGAMSKLPGNNPIGQWGVNAPAPPAGPPASPPSSPPAGPPASPPSSPPAGPPASPPSSPPAGPPASPPSSPPASPPASPPPASSAAAPPAPPAPAPPAPVSPNKPTKGVNNPKPSGPGVIHTASPPAEAPGGYPTGAPAPNKPGSPNTMVTSYVSETTVVWTTVTAPLPAATGGSQVAAGWSYHGCFSDKREGDRALSGIKFANIGNHQVTNTKCVDYCGAKGYSMAGTEYGGQCFCGNALSGSSPVDESKCSMPCEGDASQTCGGSLTLSVYATSKKRQSRHLHQHLRHDSY